MRGKPNSASSVPGVGQRCARQWRCAFPFGALLWKIGMTRTVTETNWRGHFVMSSQVWSAAKDFVRLDLLYLNDGVWNGEGG
jgi:hypothetical protein